MTIAAPAHAQDVFTPDAATVDADRYLAPLPGDDFMVTAGAGVGGHLIPRGSATYDVVHRPFTVTRGGEVVGRPVGSLLMLHLGFSAAIWDRLLVAVNAPVGLWRTGETTVVDGRVYPRRSGAHFGDLRFSMRGRVYGERGDAFRLALGQHLWFPTAGADSYVGDNQVYAKPEIVVDGEIDMIRYAVQTGVVVRGGELPSSYALRVAGGVRLLDDALMLGPEVLLRVDLADEAVDTGAARVGAELYASASYRLPWSLVAGVAAGPGLAGGIGTPGVRGLFRLSYDPERHATATRRTDDRDGDRIPDRGDACPDAAGLPSAEPTRHGCPSDRDRDGVFDAEDACPDVRGELTGMRPGCPPPPDTDGDGFVDPEDGCPKVPGIQAGDGGDGCPPKGDRDQDLVPDEVDACPARPGRASEDAEENGCPPDTDGDGLRDDVDECDESPGPDESDTPGCPRVTLLGTAIVIRQEIAFAPGRTEIDPVSYPTLDDVAVVMADHPEIDLLEIQGHTDDVGSPDGNRRLSRKRASEVRRYLVKKGVAQRRLIAKGYGPDVPIGDNDTEAGRAMNRRVQFVIRRRK